MELKKGLISGIIGGLVLLILGFVLMSIAGTQEWYNTTFPQMMTIAGMWAILASAILMGLFMGLVYSVINEAVPGKGIKKGINYGIIVWLLAGVMWPIMMIGFAPAYMWIVELISGFIAYSITGAVIAVIYEKI